MIPSRVAFTLEGFVLCGSEEWDFGVDLHFNPARGKKTLAGKGLEIPCEIEHIPLLLRLLIPKHTHTNVEAP